MTFTRAVTYDDCSSAGAARDAAAPAGEGLTLGSGIETLHSPGQPLMSPRDLAGMEDTGFLTCMTLVLLGNYAQTGHFGGPLAYTPYNRSEEHTSELQSLRHLVCRLLLEKKKK